MNRTRQLLAVAGLLAITVPFTSNAQAKGANAAKRVVMPKAGLRAELITDVEMVERKFSQLATAMSGKYSWRPADKVRSVSEVLQHVSGENYALPVVLGVKAPQGFAASTMQEAFGSAAEMEKITDEAAVKAEIDKSFAHMKQAIASLSDAELNAPIEVFGQKTTKRGFLVMIVTHMHEHLGQVVAYARMSGVVPPWSAASGG
jgi:uncharacterized damage-inducible protein DinB